MFKWRNVFLWASATFMALTLSGCGYNTLQTTDEDIKATWAEVLNQYQRRADLVPNLVNVVKGYAAHEKDVLISVTEARARVGAIQATPELINDEAAFQKFIAAQGELTGAISRLLLVAENYPQLKADGLFRDLQAQLEGTENRITVARNRYIAAVKTYNVTVRSFPSNLTAMLFGYKTKPSFTVENEKAIAVPPKVDFGAPLRHRPRLQAALDPRMSRLARTFASGLFLLLCALSAWAQVAVPELSRRVTDLTATLDAGQVAALEGKLAAFEAQKGSQIAVLIVPTTQPEDIAQFGIRVAEQWKIGREKIDDGVILIVAKDDRKLRLGSRLRAGGRDS